MLHLGHGDHALQSCMVHLKLTETGPPRPGMAWVGTRGACYPLNHRWGYHLLPDTLFALNGAFCGWPGLSYQTLFVAGVDA